MLSESPSRLRRLSWHLPLSIAGLLALAVGAVSWIAYRDVRGAALAHGADRLEDSAEQLGALLSSSRFESIRAAAEDPAVLRALKTPSSGSVAQARGVLERALSESDEEAAALWDASAALVTFTAGDRSQGSVSLPQARPPNWAAADSVSISGFRHENGAIWFDGAAPVLEGETLLGHIVVTSLLASDPAVVRRFSDLIAPGATFIVGQRGGTWTDLAGLADPPPEEAFAAARATPYESASGHRVLGHGRQLNGPPWLLWIEVPVEPMLDQAREFLSRIIPVGFLVVMAGAAGGVMLSNRINARLGHVRSAATAIASGAYDRRAPTGSYAELDQLAVAFNFMAEQVGDSHARLEEQIVARTAALEATEAEFRALATTAPDAIVTADADGHITYFNPGAERIFGLAADDAVGQPLTILMPDRFQEAHQRGLSRHVREGDGQFAANLRELVGRRRDGSEFPLELALAGRRHGNGMSFTGIIRDITDRKQREEAVRRYASELEAANRELEAFSYSVSHDLRAPLRAIHGFSQALAEDYEERLDEQGVRILGRVRAGAERMGVLIDDLLELSRATRAEMRRERIDVTGLSRRIVAELAATEPQRDVEVRIAQDLVASADPHLLTLVLSNLIGNAWKFTGKEEQAIIDVGCSEAYEFYVRDNGAGFDMAYVDKLFHPFQRLHPESEFAGTGVGLALVHRIIHRHGGSVRAEGAVGRGATFHFTLPTQSQQEGRLET